MPDPTTPQVAPKVNDQYWFTYSESLVTNGLENRNKAAATIQSFILWLWGIYTASASIGFALSGKELDPLLTAFIALASASIIAVYAGTVWVQMPLSVPFDPRSPEDIANVYLENMKAKNYRLQFTLWLSIISAIMVSVSLVVASVAKPLKPVEPDKTVAPSLSVAIIQHYGEATRLSVTSLVGKAKEVTIRVSSLDPKIESANANYHYTPTEDGLLQASIPIDEKIKEAMVSAEWEDANGTKMQLSRKVKAEI